MPSPQAVIYFLLIWTFVSVPLAMLVGAVIKFGADDKLSFDQIDRKLQTPSREMRRVAVVAEKRVSHFGRLNSQ
jgi:hypothetical protein